MIELTALLGGIIASILGNVIENFFQKRKKQETIEDRVRKLTSSMDEAAKLIGQIESEINKRSMLAEKLKNDIEYYEKLKNINANEVEAIAQVLRSELYMEGKRSFWKGVSVNFIFFLLGVFASYLISKIA